MEEPESSEASVCLHPTSRLVDSYECLPSGLFCDYFVYFAEHLGRKHFHHWAISLALKSLEKNRVSFMIWKPSARVPRKVPIPLLNNILSMFHFIFSSYLHVLIY